MGIEAFVISHVAAECHRNIEAITRIRAGPALVKLPRAWGGRGCWDERGKNMGVLPKAQEEGT